MNRFGAFAIHLGISLLIFLVVGWIILAHWYPDFFFTADGGWQGIRIIALVDLVLGPTLTLVVYKKGKPSLKFDLTVIALFQTVCLAAGIWVVYSERPLAMVYADGSFQTMTADDYQEANRPIPRFEGFSDSPPHWIFVQLPEDPESQSTVRKESRLKGRSIKTAVEYYVPFEPENVMLDRDGLTPYELERVGIGALEEFAHENGGVVDDYIFLPFGTRYEQALIAMHRKNGQLLYFRIEKDFADEASTDPGG